MEGTHAALQQAALAVPLGFGISADALACFRRSGGPLSLGNAHSRDGGYSRTCGAYARAIGTLAFHTELRPGRAAIRGADYHRSGRRGAPPPGPAHAGNRRRIRPLPQRAGLRGRRVAGRHAASLRTTADPLYYDSGGGARATQAPGGWPPGRAPGARPEADSGLVRETPGVERR